MDRFQEMQVFVRVADRSSFAQASDDLQIPRATVTNLVQRLEARVGARLLDRTTRQVRLTPEGEDYYRRCIRLLADLQEAESAFRHAPPQGLLRVNLQGTLARFFVMPHLGDFAQQYPGVQLHMAEDDRLVDLVREGVDCVLRAGSLQSSTLIGRQVASLRQVTVVSRGYAERHGLPESLDDLAQHAAVAYVSSATGRPVALEFCVGKQVVERRLKPSITVNGADLYTGAAMAGWGWCRCRATALPRRWKRAWCWRCCPICLHLLCRCPYSIPTAASLQHGCGYLLTGWQSALRLWVRTLCEAPCLGLNAGQRFCAGNRPHG